MLHHLTKAYERDCIAGDHETQHCESLSRVVQTILDERLDTDERCPCLPITAKPIQGSGWFQNVAMTVSSNRPRCADPTMQQNKD